MSHFVDFDTMLAVPARQVTRRLVDHCAPWAERLGCATELGYIEDIIEHGSGASLQKQSRRQSDDGADIVQSILDATGNPWDPVGG